ncbi:hypothetical protein HUJ05_005323 [Dendroctonus ponderosae]|nr:hypothetical protein HUJ05_005323 [Dendroctonus ponderosae]
MSQIGKSSQGKANGKNSGSKKGQKVKNNQPAVSSPAKKSKLSEDRNSKLKQLQIQRMQLPIYLHKNELMEVIEDSKSLVIVGETGCGKTTQIPQYIDEDNLTRPGKIAITQPRRVAAISVATRVAQEYGLDVFFYLFNRTLPDLFFTRQKLFYEFEVFRFSDIFRQILTILQTGIWFRCGFCMQNFGIIEVKCSIPLPFKGQGSADFVLIARNVNRWKFYIVQILSLCFCSTSNAPSAMLEIAIANSLGQSIYAVSNCLNGFPGSHVFTDTVTRIILALDFKYT